MCRTLKNWVTHISAMERDFRKAKKLWTGAGEEPDDSLHGNGTYQTLHEQRLEICPEWDEYVQMGCAKMAKFGGGHTSESALPDSESDGESDATAATITDSDAAQQERPVGSGASKRKRKEKRKTASDVDIPPALTREQEEYADNKKREANRDKMGQSDAEILRDISEHEASAKKEDAETKLAAQKAEADLAVKTKNASSEMKYAFKEKQLLHAQNMDMKAHARQMSIDEAKGKREEWKLLMKMLKELKADHEKEEDKKLERIVALQEKNIWDRLPANQQEKLLMRAPAPTMQTVRDLMALNN